MFAIQAQRAGTKNSPARKGWVHRQAIEHQRCGTTLFVCSLGAKPRDLQFHSHLNNFLGLRDELGVLLGLANALWESPFGITRTFVWDGVKLQIPRLRSGMTKGRVVAEGGLVRRKENCRSLGCALNEQRKSVVPHLRRSTAWLVDPALPGWADVWRAALWAWIANTAFPCSFHP